MALLQSRPSGDRPPTRGSGAFVVCQFFHGACLKKSLKRRAPAPNTAANGREPSRVVVRKRAENEDDADGCDSASWADLSPGETDACSYTEMLPTDIGFATTAAAVDQRRAAPRGGPGTRKRTSTCIVFAVALALAAEDCKRPAHANERLADTI